MDSWRYHTISRQVFKESGAYSHACCGPMLTISYLRM